MKKIIFLSSIISLFGCTQSYDEKINNILQQHKEPREDQENRLSVGETIVFRSEEKMGIDRSKYPSPTYEKNIDKAFFEYIKTETIDDGSDGGSEYSFEMYKSIKAGVTKIEIYKTEGKQLNNPMLNDTIDRQKKLLDGLYGFSISQ